MPQQQRAVTWPFVDMVRASSALLVMFGHVRFFHFQGIANVADPGPFTMFFYLVSGLQHEAVVLFFVISGFLVGGPIVGDISSRRFDAWRYLVNRFVRIYIVFVPSLVLVWVLYALVAPFLAGTRILAEIPAGPEGFFLNFRQFLCHAVCLQGLACSVWTKNPLLWSLGFEWALYLFAPLIVAAWFAPAAWIWRAVAVLLSVAAFATVSPGDVEWLFWVATWFCGLVAYRMLLTRPIGLPWGLAASAILVAGLAASRIKLLPPRMTDIAIALALAAAFTCPRLLKMSPAPRLFAMLAGFSYSLFILHQPITVLLAGLFERAGWPNAGGPSIDAYVAFLVTSAIAISVSMIFAKLTEEKTAAVRRMITVRKTHHAASPNKASPVAALEDDRR